MLPFQYSSARVLPEMGERERLRFEKRNKIFLQCLRKIQPARRDVILGTKKPAIRYPPARIDPLGPTLAWQDAPSFGQAQISGPRATHRGRIGANEGVFSTSREYSTPILRATKSL
jgi:hypothetical protein